MRYLLNLFNLQYIEIGTNLKSLLKKALKNYLKNVGKKLFGTTYRIKNQIEAIQYNIFTKVMPLIQVM